MFLIDMATSQLSRSQEWEDVGQVLTPGKQSCVDHSDSELPAHDPASSLNQNTEPPAKFSPQLVRTTVSDRAPHRVPAKVANENPLYRRYTNRECRGSPRTKKRQSTCRMRKGTGSQSIKELRKKISQLIEQRAHVKEMMRVNGEEIKRLQERKAGIIIGLAHDTKLVVLSSACTTYSF